MQNVQIFVLIVVIVNVFYVPLYADEASLNEVLSVLEETQKNLSPDENINYDCENNDSYIIANSDEMEVDQGSSVAPIYLFRKDYRINYGLRLKNDIFAAPTSLLRYGSFIIFDQGETHGTEVDVGIKFQNDHRVSYRYETNLYTQRSPFPFLAQTTGFFQDYTSEQNYQLAYDNLESNEWLSYKLTLGKIDYIRDNDDDIFLASTQQKLLHNFYDVKYLGTDYYEVENHHRRSNKTGVMFRPNLGLSAKTVNSDRTQGQHGRLYIEPEFSTFSDRNNVTLGLSYDLYLSNRNEEKELPFGVILPKDAFGAHVGLDLPVSFHQRHTKETSNWSTNLSPELKLGVSVGDLEFGYSTNMVFGTIPNHIEENRNYKIKRDNKYFIDHGDMGQAYFRLNKKF